MYKAIGIWSWPAEHDLDAFEDHYLHTHCDLARRLPGLVAMTGVRGVDGRDGLFRLAEVCFEDAAAYRRAAESDEWSAMAADAMGLIERFSITLEGAHGEEQDLLG